jgi:methionyl-tRNA formyltransferase
MRLVFAGTPDAAVPSLRALALRHEIAAVVTRTDAPVGRKRVLTPSAVARAAADLGLPVLKTDRLDADATDRIQQLRADLGVIVAYGGLVREPLLSSPAHGWINLHFSLLPRWRGAAPVQRALIAGDRVTGASVFQLVPELDAGDVFAELPYDVPADATAADVLDALADAGAGLVADVVDGIGDGTAVATPQRGAVTVAPKISLADGVLDFAEPAVRIVDRVRGTTPEPGAHTTVAGQRLTVVAASVAASDAGLPPGRIDLVGRDVLVGAGEGAVVLHRVRPAGRNSMAAADWWRGARLSDAVAGS